MSNKEIAHQFTLLSRLMDIHGESSFRSKTYSVAAYKINQLPAELEHLPENEILKINGIGEAIGNRLQEILATGSMQVLTNLLEKTPPGIIEMMKIKGIGPKKIHIIWKEMDIESIGELLYACQENRLLLYKGFGKKTQDNVVAAIEFYLSQQGSYLYSQIENTVIELTGFFRKLFNTDSVTVTGEVARHNDTVDVIDVVILAKPNDVHSALAAFPAFEYIETSGDTLIFKYNQGIKIKINAACKQDFTEKVFATTGSEEFVSGFHRQFPDIQISDYKTEADLFKAAGLQFIPPYLRDLDEIISIAKEQKIPKLIQPEDIRGIIHCHSNWSDGINTIEQLAAACIETGKEYLVLSDHSKTASYAQGLTEDRIRAQHQRIDELNETLSPFRIFKSIESDILNDGELDYSSAVLDTFDLVIVSIHSNLKMSEEKAMSRLLKAIENPYTTILGHMTGRLLLSRRGYPVDHKKVIDACAANGVVIEINANPRRLDMRWQWIPYALSRNVMLSINPDAHAIGEFEKTRFGVLVAQKAMLTSGSNLSSLGLADFETFIKNRKRKKM